MFYKNKKRNIDQEEECTMQFKHVCNTAVFPQSSRPVFMKEFVLVKEQDSRLKTILFSSWNISYSEVGGLL